MMNFASEQFNDRHESNHNYEFSRSVPEKSSEDKRTFKLFSEKICVPSFAAPVARPRLIEQLKKSSAQFSATLITGRAGMGKTILAADFAVQSRCPVAWYKAETADIDWKVFSNYLLGSLKRCCPEFNSETSIIENSEVSVVTENLAAGFNCAAEDQPFLIVLDDLHSVFDADWFTDFFNSFVFSLAPNVKLLLVARTLPPLQIWRLRSKQVLSVMDEKLLTFNIEETKELFRHYRLSPTAARSAHKRTYGRIAKLEEIALKKTLV